MSDLAEFMVHTVALRPFGGNGSQGPILGDEQERQVFVDSKRRVVRDKDGAQVVAEATIHDVDLEAEELYRPESEVTLPGGRVATIISCRRLDGGALDLPDHLEVSTT